VIPVGTSRAAAGGRAVIIGGSVSGLVTAVALAGLGAQVEVLERDRPPESSVDGVMDGWWRRGAPQARHSHSCLALGRKLLRERASNACRALLARGCGRDSERGGLASDGS
jgi:2-polyprenyl-6-methoxyphenol hydroxylase-like FAD-dependent oxidoreductase